ncbi:MAG: undecaprenyl-diphosphate phosphatase [Alphaproteobacteria bacterium]|nr:MAG: undecaprenyl-diphosphate phosphatase [Alphaproteobacteria bacterium]
MTIIQAIIIAIVEGLTEFLPVSSTGHMILTSAALGVENSEFLRTFEISIQIGAIMAIVMMYMQRFFRGFEIYKKLIIAFIPTAIVGFLAYPYIKDYLFSPLIVSISLILGGIILIIVDKKVSGKITRYNEVENLSVKHAFFIGLVQCISMIPGVSRAGATIVGGVFNGLNKKQATEFSFLLAVPTMFAATGYDLYKTPLHFSSYEFTLLLIGLVTAFIFAWLAVKIFLVLVNKYGFFYFGWYRIVIGVLFLVLILKSII